MRLENICDFRCWQSPMWFAASFATEADANLQLEAGESKDAVAPPKCTSSTSKCTRPPPPESLQDSVLMVQLGKQRQPALLLPAS